tara:strand:+ start:65 stop:1669 length:1605 start_codon:yes stop_codon:yes gene_type:complete
MNTDTPTDLNAPAKYKIDKGFYDSDEYKGLDPNRAGTAAFTYSPYFGMASSGHIGDVDQAYKAYAKRMGFNPNANFVAKTTGSTNTGNTNMAAITTDDQLREEIGKLASGQQGVMPKVEAVLPTVKSNELQTTTGSTVTGDVTSSVASPIVPITPAKPVGQEGVGQISSVATNVPQIGEAKAAQITDAKGVISSIPQGTVSQQSIVDPAQAELDQRATVKFQLGSLFESLKEGEELPPWAAPAVRKVSAVMQARGLGASSMASAAITQAVMESGIPIAAQDANKYATIQLQNLNNSQQAALTNAATFAAMDKANLSARLQGAVTNAQSLLAVDTANLSAQQKSNELSYSALTQGLFKDTAEENARREFNAKNETQVQEFFAELGSQVETANANRTAAVQQFNAGETNAMNQFNASMTDARDKFNANMKFAIDQSNTQWRRQVNTAGTALQNETNRINVQNQYNLTQTALSQLWQKYRDNAAWNFQKSESAAQRQHEIGVMAMEFANSQELYDQEQKDAIGTGVGNWLATWIRGA